MANLVADFKKFLLRGNLVELAVAFVIGAVFAALVKAFIADLIHIPTHGDGPPSNPRPAGVETPRRGAPGYSADGVAAPSAGTIEITRPRRPRVN